MDASIVSLISIELQVLSQSYLYWMNVWLMLYPMWLCFDWTFNSIDVLKNVWDYRIVFVALFYYALWKLIRHGSR